MKKFNHPVFISIIMLITLAYVLALSAHAQNVVQQGKVFVEQPSGRSHKATEIKTEYTYQDSKGNVDTVYLSTTGKAFIFKVSKKGNVYKKYLPEVGKKINPTAYEERTDSSKRKGHE